MSHYNQKVLRLGDEWDEDLRCAVRNALIALDAKVSGADSGIVGSQELQLLDVWIDGHAVRVESETYIGLSVSGPEDIVEKIRALVADRTRTK